MNFTNSTTEDLDEIFGLYAAAIEFQKKVSAQTWLPFEREFIEKEIAEKRHWKITIDEQIACIFSTSSDDSLIWQEKNNEKSIYLHRVAVNPEFREVKFFPKVVEWLRVHAKNLDKKYIRMDTWSDNQKLFDYYKRLGFKFLGVMSLRNSSNLPKHYEGIAVSLFEMKID
jgi:ribosomal protein S18 acetylase RimI-like enzyme